MYIDIFCTRSAKSDVGSKAVTRYNVDMTHYLKSMWNTAVGIKNCKQPFSLRLAFATEKKATPTAVMMSVLCGAIFWVVKASSCEKNCLQFSIPTGFGVGGEGGVSHRLKVKCHIFPPTLPGSVGIKNYNDRYSGGWLFLDRSKFDSTVSINYAVGSYLLLPRSVQPPE